MRSSLVTSALFAALALSACKKEAAAPAAAPAAPASASSAAAPAAPAAAPKEQVFAQGELDQMVAPIALYPDSLLAQVLMAATYPGDVADAVAWSKANPKAQGDEAVRQVASQPWDPSVQSLVAFPQALALMGQDPAWVQRLGDAFLAQPDDVMDAVQRLRRQAQSAGNLQSNEYQKVAVQPAAVDAGSASAPSSGAASGGGGDQIIVIEPASPDVVYVPSYNPTTVYGSWAYPSYPPAYYPPPAAYYPVGTALASGLAFGVGLAITDSLWGGFDWHDDDVNINVNRYNNINVNNRLDVNQNRWSHDTRHRDGVPYRDQANRERYGRQLDGADRRTEFRGDDASRAQARARASESMQRRGVDAPARNNQQARDAARQSRDQAGRTHAGRDLDNLNQRQPRPEAGRDAARERAASTASSHQARDQARDRAAGQGQRAGGMDRAQAGQHRAQTAERPRSSQANNAARNQARQQSGGNRAAGGGQHNAFEGASRPGGSHAASQRGNSSRAASSNRTASARAGGGGGHQVNRASHPPQRQGGGGGGRHR